jgi:hypothetical protein
MEEEFMIKKTKNKEEQFGKMGRMGSGFGGED